MIKLTAVIITAVLVMLTPVFADALDGECTHENGEVKTREPTCATYYGKYFECPDCGFIEWINGYGPLPHTFDEYYEREATCTEDAHVDAHCSVCDQIVLYSSSYGTALGHLWTLNGEELVCSRCGDTKPVSECEHDYSEGYS
ncbi:MAG: hypothetical protein K6C36_04820, partial [Clostridia bacterium]|nr:hypothetical protein [Clostridia bacterium]